MHLVAADYLDAGGENDGAKLRDVADEAMKTLKERRLRWEPRFDAISAYHGTPKLSSYFEYLAGRLADPEDSPLDSTRNGIYAIFAANGRCDLVRRASAPKLNDCVKAIDDAKIYTDPPPSFVRSAEQTARLFGGDITTDEAGLAEATAKPTLFLRMGMLNLIATRARRALSGASGR